MADDRSINIGGGSYGGIHNTGDGNTISSGAKPPILVEINKASRALEDARDEIAKPTPDKDELNENLERAAKAIAKAIKLNRPNSG